MGIHWEVVVIALPIFAAIGCFLWFRQSLWIGLSSAFVTLFSVVMLSVQVAGQGAQSYAMGGWQPPLGIALAADGLSILMLIMTAVVSLGISIYSIGYFKADKARHFWPLMMLLWATLNALFLSADIFNIYVTFELLGLAAVALVALSGGADALTAAMRYLLVSLLGSLFYLLGMALLYHSFGTVDILLLAERMESTPVVWAAMGLMTAGLLLKTALFPLHFWLPPAHSSAPAPVSALLSALVVKASFYVLLRLWLEVFPTASVEASQLLGILGALAVLWGGIRALQQTRLKLLIAYSTVVQIGYLFLAFPLASVAGWKATFYIVLSHAIAKTAMFMAAGNILHDSGHDRIADLDRVAQRLPLTLAAFGLAGASLMGLPPSGGFIGKWLMLEAAISSDQWWWGLVLITGGLLTGAYVFRVIGHAFTKAELPQEHRAVPMSMEWAALLVATLAIVLSFVAPWILALLDVGSPFGVTP